MLPRMRFGDSLPHFYVCNEGVRLLYMLYAVLLSLFCCLNQVEMRFYGHAASNHSLATSPAEQLPTGCRRCANAVGRVLTGCRRCADAVGRVLTGCRRCADAVGRVLTGCRRCAHSIETPRLGVASRYFLLKTGLYLVSLNNSCKAEPCF